MNVEYTGRQYEVTPAIRKEVETGLTKIRKILGDKFETKVVLVVEKHRHKAEITISPRKGPIVGLAEAGDMKSAVNEALEHIEKQALKYKTRWRSKKRKSHRSGTARPRRKTFKRPWAWTKRLACLSSCIDSPQSPRPQMFTSSTRTMPWPCAP